MQSHGLRCVYTRARFLVFETPPIIAPAEMRASVRDLCARARERISGLIRGYAIESVIRSHVFRRAAPARGKLMNGARPGGGSQSVDEFQCYNIFKLNFDTRLTG